MEHPCCIQCFNMTPRENLVTLNRGHLTLYRRFPNRWIGRACPVIWPLRSPDLSPRIFSVEAILKKKISLVSYLHFVISSGYLSIILLTYMWPFRMILYLVLYFSINKIKTILYLYFIVGRFYMLVFIFLSTASTGLRPWGNRLGHFTSLTLGHWENTIRSSQTTFVAI